MSTYTDPEGFAEWAAGIPESFKRDPIWRMPAYRYGVWLAELVKRDVRALRKDPDCRNIADQLLRAVEGISANLSEGYSRRTGAERARYYDYALATARESRDWYFKARVALGTEVMEQRHGLLDRIIRILTAVVPRERDAPPLTRRRKPESRDTSESPMPGDSSSSS